jgi:hypothetical protein
MILILGSAQCGHQRQQGAPGVSHPTDGPPVQPAPAAHIPAGQHPGPGVFGAPAPTGRPDRQRTILIILSSVLAAMTLLVGATIAVAVRLDHRSDPTATAPVARQSEAAGPAPETSETPAAAGSTVVLVCQHDNGGDYIGTITADTTGNHDFTKVWAAGKLNSCDASTPDGTPVLPIGKSEQAAYAISGYAEPDPTLAGVSAGDGSTDSISGLFELCATTDPADTYNTAGFAAGEAQIREMTAALLLCPRQPYAARWRAAIAAGKKEAALSKDGRLFSDGTYTVGVDVKAGTYQATDVTNCYWERQNRQGRTIANDFVVAGPRVQVTIAASDFAFIAEGCGQWKPVS